MKRFKWYRTSWPLPMREIGARLKDLKFAPNVSDGFVLDRIRDDYVEGRYVERNEVHETTVDPFGSEYRFDRIEFPQWHFRASDTEPGLEIHGSIRGSRSLTNRLAEVADHQLFIQDYTVDVSSWLQACLTRMDMDGFVDIMQINALEIDKGISVRTTVTGKRDVQETVKFVVGSRTHSISKLRYKLVGSHKGAITLSSAAAATIKMEDSEGAGECVRAALQEIS